MHEVGGLLSVRCGGEDEPPIALQYLQPASDVAGVIGAGMQLKTKVGAEEGGPQFGDQFFVRIAVVAPALAAEIAVEPGRVPGPMDVMPTSA